MAKTYRFSNEVAKLTNLRRNIRNNNEYESLEQLAEVYELVSQRDVTYAVVVVQGRVIDHKHLTSYRNIASRNKAKALSELQELHGLILQMNTVPNIFNLQRCEVLLKGLITTRFHTDTTLEKIQGFHYDDWKSIASELIIV